jgi:hypothetical protein
VPRAQDVAASYLIGALGGIVYLRLLNKSVDSVGEGGLGAAAAGAASQPRLLIPVVLVLFFNRCAPTRWSACPLTGTCFLRRPNKETNNFSVMAPSNSRTLRRSRRAMSACRIRAAPAPSLFCAYAALTTPVDA